MVLDYLQKIDLKDSKTPEQFWKSLYRKYDQNLIKKLETIVNERNDKLINTPYLPDLYEIKNQDLELSIDFASYSGDLYRRFLEWIIRKNIPTPAKILDIGSDNGIITCFLGMMYPGSEITGIDPCSISVECAGKLADKLSLKNVVFKQASINLMEDLYDKNYFDLIITVRTFHEILGVPSLNYWSLNDILVESKEEDRHLKVLKKLLRDDNSMFISWERLPDCGKYIWWIKTMENAGLHVHWAQCDIIKFHEVGEGNSMPLFVARTTPDINQDDLTANVIKLFYKYDHIDCYSSEYDGFIAEYMFNQYIEKNLVYGFEVVFKDQTGRTRLEIWQTQSNCLLYQYSNFGFRSMTIFTKDLVEVLKHNLNQSKLKFKSAGNNVLEYN